MKYRLLLALAIATGAILLVSMANYDKPRKHIILNSIPKSGSTYIATSLSQGLNYERTKINSDADLVTFFKNHNKIAKQHLRAPADYCTAGLFCEKVVDIEILKKHTDKIVIHVRDPRQVLLSLVHHINIEKQRQAARMPQGYFKQDLTKQIDWNIEHTLPHIISWMKEWLTLNEQEELSNNGLKIMFSTYEEFMRDEQGFYDKILKFYGIPKHRFSFKAPVKDARVRYRNGSTDEWREVFTPAQKKRIAAIVPQSLLERFNWEK